MKHKRLIRKSSTKRLLQVFFFVSFGLVGVSLVLFTSAATVDDPIGFADSCHLEGSTTVIWGWAHDSSSGYSNNPMVQVTAGGKTVTVPTDVPNYRTTDINTTLTATGRSTSDKYGFVARFDGLYKGTKPTISGTIINDGPGSNQPLGINTFNPSALYWSTYQFENGNIIPDVCLSTAPAPIQTPTSPSPTPSTPTTTTTQKQTTTAKKTTTSSSQPAQQTAAPAQTTTPTTTDNTEGKKYTAVLSFYKNSGGVTVTVSSEDLKLTAKKSDNNQLTLNDIPQGSYPLTIEYDGVKYAYTLDVAKGQSPEPTNGNVLSYTIDVGRLSPVGSTPSTNDQETPAQSSASWWKILLLVFAVLGAGVAVFLFIRKRKSSADAFDGDTYYDNPPPQEPSYDLPHATTNIPTIPSQPHDPNIHTGVSLKDMVLESMRAQAAKQNRK